VAFFLAEPEGGQALSGFAQRKSSGDLI